MTLLEERLQTVEEVLDANTTLFVEGFKALEIQQLVTVRILQDVFNGRVRIKDMVSDDNGVPTAAVDVDSYIREFLEARDKLAEEKTASPIVPPSYDGPIIFGGDTP